MRRLLRWLLLTFTSLLLCVLIGIAAFDLRVVQPVVSKIEASVAAAAPSERTPPALVIEMLRRAYGSRVNDLVARRVLFETPNQVEGMSTLRRAFTELGVALLLPLHLSESEVSAAFAAGAHMGPGIVGFAEASRTYIGVPLEEVTARQAAQLVAIAHAPSAYVGNPQRLERRTQYLLSLPPQ